MNTLSRDMRSWRAVYRLNQKSAADVMGVALKTWQRWERGDSKPESQNYRELRQLLAQAPPGWVRLLDQAEASGA